MVELYIRDVFIISVFSQDTLSTYFKILMINFIYPTVIKTNIFYPLAYSPKILDGLLRYVGLYLTQFVMLHLGPPCPG